MPTTRQQMCRRDDSSADESSEEEFVSSEEEFVEDAYDLSEFLGATILRLRERMRERDSSRRGQTRREEESRAAVVDNMSAPIAGSRSGRTKNVAEADGERTTSNSQNQSSSNNSNSPGH